MILWRSPHEPTRPDVDSARGLRGPATEDGAPRLIRVATSGGEKEGGKCVSLLLDKPQPGEKETVVYAEGEDVLARFDMTGAIVEVRDGVTVVIFPDGAQIEIVGLEDITLLGDISPEAGEQQNNPEPGRQ